MTRLINGKTSVERPDANIQNNFQDKKWHSWFFTSAKYIHNYIKQPHSCTLQRKRLSLSLLQNPNIGTFPCMQIIFSAKRYYRNCWSLKQTGDFWSQNTYVAVGNQASHVAWIEKIRSCLLRPTLLDNE